MGLERLLAPRSIAISGASENVSPGRRILEMLDTLGYEGEVYPINPRYEAVLGRPCHAAIADIPRGVDAIVFCVNHTRVLEPYREAAAHGIGGAVILDGGFAERGEEGRRLQDEIVAISRAAGMALCGPNCMGVLSPHHRASLYTSMLVDPAPLAGNVAVVTQSGSIALGLLTDCRRFGFSHLVSAGNEAVTCTADYIDYLADDPNTRVIATFTETINQPERFVAALDKAADRGKPVVVLKVGKSARAKRAIIGHTGSLAGEARVVSALLARHRAIEVDDMEELTEVLACCQGARWPAGPRIGVVTASGGQAELVLDIAGAAGLDLPPLSEAARRRAGEVIGPVTGDGNPLDAWGDGRFQVNIPHALKVLGEEPGLESVVLFSDTNDGQPMAPTRYTPFLAEAARVSDRSFFYMTTRHGLFRRELVGQLREADVTVLSGVRPGLAAIGRLGRWAQASPGKRPEPAVPPVRLASVAGVRRTVNELDAKRLLAGYGLPTAAERRADDAAGALAAAAEIGYPVVLKAVSDELPHRTEHGLVALGIDDEAALRKAFVRLAAGLAALPARPRDVGFVVQQWIGDAVEVFAGISRDPQFGPTIAFGAGGVLVEVLGEVAFRPLPLFDGDAEAMIAETRAAVLLDGVRGRPPADKAALARLLYLLADYAWAERDGIAEIDLNPVMVLPAGQGCVIVDALIVPATPDDGESHER